MGLHDGVGHEGGRDGHASEPTAVEAIDGLARVVDVVEFDVDVTLSSPSAEPTKSVMSQTYR